MKEGRTKEKGKEADGKMRKWPAIVNWKDVSEIAKNLMLAKKEGNVTEKLKGMRCLCEWLSSVCFSIEFALNSRDDALSGRG